MGLLSAGVPVRRMTRRADRSSGMQALVRWACARGVCARGGVVGERVGEQVGERGEARGAGFTRWYASSPHCHARRPNTKSHTLALPPPLSLSPRGP